MIHAMRAEQQGLPLGKKSFHPTDALLLKGFVTDRQDFVSDEDIGVDRSSDRKSQTHEHAGGVSLHWPVDEIPQAREIDNLRKKSFALLPAEPHHGGRKVNIFPASIFRVKAGAEFEERPDSPFDL